MRLRQVDLNLLNVFDAVMRHRSVTEAAGELALSPSAVSHALGRLRLALKDDLFIRDERGMTPTARAMELAATVRDGLALLERALAPPPFRPEQAARSFRIAAGDYTCTFMLPALVRRLRQSAPAIDLRIIPVSRPDIGRLLNAGTVDLVLGWFEKLPADFHRRLLLRESGGIVVRAGHPLAQGPLTLERVAQFPHAVVDLTADQEARHDGFLDDRGLVRRVWMERLILHARETGAPQPRVALSVPHFTALPFMLADTDLVATMPWRMARWAAKNQGLVFLGPLLGGPDYVEIEMVWHRRSEADAGLQWLASTLLDAVQQDAEEVSME
ncbi:LysR family transcriptional regulator [Acidisoma sp. C75]